jgi:AGCS family alanine or glycine:cation symporter
METIQKIVDTINTYLSDYILLILLVGMGIFFSVKTKFVQVRCFGEGMRAVFGSDSRKKGSGINKFQALTTAIAAQVGTGNIVGACGAILIGGPGAIFWMWVIAFFGMSTIYAEAVLAQKTKTVDADGTVKGGHVYYIKAAFKGNFGKFLAGFFSVAIILALGFVGAMVQSNSIAENFEGVFTQFGADGTVVRIIVGVVVAAIAGFVLIGGTQRLASVTEKIVPVMACLYLLGGVLVLCVNIVNVPAAIGMIFQYAFMPQAIIGGAFGAAIKAAISQGAKRGLFSNEAGMGSTPHAHALANVKDPHTQGTTAMIGVFIDTFVVLTMTALIVISTLYCDGTITAAGAAEGVSKANMVQLAFQKTFGVLFGTEAGNIIGGFFVSICLFFFAFSTILSWNYFGKVNFLNLFGKKSKLVYSIIAIVFVFLGSIFQNDLVWELTDMFNNLMVLPNAIALFALGGVVVSMTKFGKK